LTRGVALFAALCLIATACAGGNQTPPVLVEPVPFVARPVDDEYPDRMIPIAPLEASARPAPEPTSAPTQPVVAASGSSHSAAAISQTPSEPPADPAPPPPPPPPPTKTPAPPKPTATPKPPAPTATPVIPANCPSTLRVEDGDDLVRAAQQLPALFYGGGLCAGDRVEALIGGSSCGAATVNSAGQWSIAIRTGASCSPVEGATVTLTVNGKAAASATWKSGGLPPDVTNGYTLSR